MLENPFDDVLDFPLIASCCCCCFIISAIFRQYSPSKYNCIICDSVFDNFASASGVKSNSCIFFIKSIKLYVIPKSLNSCSTFCRFCDVVEVLLVVLGCC